MEKCCFCVCIYQNETETSGVSCKIASNGISLARYLRLFLFLCDQNDNLSPKYRRNFIILSFCKNFVRLSIGIEAPVFREVFLEYR